MRFFSFALSLLQLTAALYQDEAGQNDFTISTAGHGVLGVTYAQITSDQTSVLTSSSSTFGTPISTPISEGAGSAGCFVSSRSLKDGSLSWRRNVCSSVDSGVEHPKKSPYAIRHATYSTIGNEKFYTLEDNGMLRIWNDTNGAMTGEFSFEMEDLALSSGVPRLVSFENGFLGAVLSTDETEVLFFANSEGYEGTFISARDILRRANVKPLKNEMGSANASVLGVLSVSDDSKFVVVGWSHEGLSTSFSEMAMVEISFKDDKMEVLKDCKHLPHGSKNPLLLSSVEIRNGHIISTVFGGKNVVRYSYSKKDEEHTGDGISVRCESMIINSNTLDIGSKSPISSMHKLQCTQFFVTLLVSSESGKTHVFTLKKGKGAEMLWTAEEGLSNAASAIFLDNGAAQIESSEDDEVNIIESISFTYRLTSQWESLYSFATGGFAKRLSELFGSNGVIGSSKDAIFGLNKVAVVLSTSFNKVFGLDTASKGKILWTLELNNRAIWHKVVHGAASTRSSALGQGKHHPHSPEILILSHTDSSIEWKCVDGLRGNIISEAVTDIGSPVVQLLPVHGHSHANGGCKQNVILVLEDDSFITLPRAPKPTEDGLYTHVVDKRRGIFRTMKVHAEENGSGIVETVGETIFDPKVERIINVAYPQRNEVVQAPFTISGDDSVLLKYLNPHICVIVTEATVQTVGDIERNENELYKALDSSQSSTAGKKKKPVGATKPGQDSKPSQASAPAPATLFVNLLDTVSGQILHRVSHSHASMSMLTDRPATNIPVVISENWVVYAFANHKSRRTEIGVLTLHEGMIDKHGISAFYTPEQQLTFSSLSGEVPIVLFKTFAFNLPVSAIGVTNTKGGISSKNIILATGLKGNIVKIDRRLLDPRRPFGEPKASEKKEGLLQYGPLLPVSPMQVHSYSNRIEDASLIVSTAANLESQSLVLALGGPDIFFSRFVPSKGFDLLPDSFNKVAIILVVIALFMVLNTLKSMSEKKFMKLFWS